MEFYIICSNNYILRNQADFLIALKFLICFSNKFLVKFEIYIYLLEKIGGREREREKKREREKERKGEKPWIIFYRIQIQILFELFQYTNYPNYSNYPTYPNCPNYWNYSNNRIIRIIRMSQFQSWITVASEHSGYLLNILSGIQILQHHL